MARYPIGLADLLRAASALEVEDLEGLRAIESALGVERRGARTHGRTDPVPPEETPTGDRDFEASRTPDPRDSAETLEHDESEDDVSEAPEAQAPDPFRLVELEPRRRRATRLRSRPLDLGSPANIRIPLEPLVPARWTRSLLVRGLTQSSAGTELDVDALLDCAARGQTPRRIPYRDEQTLRRGVVLFVDRTPSFAPFANDVDELLGPLRVVAGPALLGELAFEGDPQHGVYDLRSGEPQPYEHPLRGSTALVLGDLGALSRRRRDSIDWVALGRRLKRAGVEPAALVPLNPKRLSREILGTWRVVPWGVRRGAAALDPTGESLPILEEEANLPVGLRILHRSSPHAFELARRLSLAARIDPALVRTMRRHFLPEADPAIEAELASSPILASRGATGLEFEDRARDALREHLAGDDEALKETHATLREFRRGHGAELTLQLEERWNRALLDAGTDPRPGIERDLRRLLSTLLQADERRERVARWAFTRMPRFPEQVRELPEAQRLHAAAALALGAGVTHDTGSDLDGALAPLIDSMPTIEVGVALQGGHVVIHEPPLPGDSPIEVPDTVPRTLELRAWSPEASEARKARKSGSPALDFVRQRFSKNPNGLGPTVETLRWRRDGEARSEGTFQTIALEDIRGHCRGLVAEREAPSGASQTPMLRVERIVVLGRTAKLRADVSGALARGRVLLDRQSHPVLGADRAWRMRAIRVEAPGREPSLRCVWELPFVEGEAAYEQRVWTRSADLVLGVLDAGDDGIASGALRAWRIAIGPDPIESRASCQLLSIELHGRGTAALFPREDFDFRRAAPFDAAWDVKSDLDPASLGEVLTDWIEGQLPVHALPHVPVPELWGHVEKVEDEFDALGPHTPIELGPFSEAVFLGNHPESATSAATESPFEATAPTVNDHLPALRALGVLETDGSNEHALDSRALAGWITDLARSASEIAEESGRVERDEVEELVLGDPPPDATSIGLQDHTRFVLSLAESRGIVRVDEYGDLVLPWMTEVFVDEVGDPSAPRESHGVGALQKAPILIADHPALKELRSWYEKSDPLERVAVLYGAPGVGTTFLARELAEEVLRSEPKHDLSVWSFDRARTVGDFQRWLGSRVPGPIESRNWKATCALVAAETSDVPTLFILDGLSRPDAEDPEEDASDNPLVMEAPVLHLLRAFAGNSRGSHRILVTTTKEPLIVKGGKRSRSIEVLGLTRGQAAQYLDHLELPGGETTRDRLLRIAGFHPECLTAIAQWARMERESSGTERIPEARILEDTPQVLERPLEDLAQWMRSDPSVPETQILAELHALGWRPHPDDVKRAGADGRVEVAHILDRYGDVHSVLARLESRGLVWRDDDGRLATEWTQREFWIQRAPSLDPQALRETFTNCLRPVAARSVQARDHSLEDRQQTLESHFRAEAHSNEALETVRSLGARVVHAEPGGRADALDLCLGVPYLHPGAFSQHGTTEPSREWSKLWSSVSATAVEFGRNTEAIDWLKGFWRTMESARVDLDLLHEPALAGLIATYSGGHIGSSDVLGAPKTVQKIEEVRRTVEILELCARMLTYRSRTHSVRWRIAEVVNSAELEATPWLVQALLGDVLLVLGNSSEPDALISRVARTLRYSHTTQPARVLAEIFELAALRDSKSERETRLKQLLRWTESERNPFIELRILRELAQVKTDSGSQRHSLSLAERGEALARQNGHHFMELDFLLLKARNVQVHGQDEAEKLFLFEEVFERSRSATQYPWVEGDALLGLAEVHQQANRLREAARNYAKASSLMEALGHPRAEDARSGAIRLASYLPRGGTKGTHRRKRKDKGDEEPPPAQTFRSES